MKIMIWSRRLRINRPFSEIFNAWYKELDVYIKIKVVPNMEKETTCHASALIAAKTTINVKATTDPSAPAMWEMAFTGSLKTFAQAHMPLKYSPF